MLANRVREVTTTTGTGDVTLGGALPAHITFADAFTTGDSVTYVIEDGDNYEIGTGTLIAVDTLERSIVSETLVDGVYTKTGAAAIPLSGNARVFCAATAAFLLDPVEVADVISEATPGAGVTADNVLLRDGNITLGGDRMYRNVDNDQLIISGGDQTNRGGNMFLYGAEHPTNPGDILFRTGANNIMFYDASNSLFRFYDRVTIDGNTTIGGNLSAGGTVNFGGGNSLLTADYADLAIGNQTGNSGVTIQSTGTGRGGIAFSYGNTTSVASRQGRFDFDHNSSAFEWITADAVRMFLSGTDLDIYVPTNFQGNDITTTGVGKFGVLTGSDTTGALDIYGGLGSTGANLILYASGATDANDILFRTGGTARLRWDNSAAEWNFQGTKLGRVGPGNGIALTIGADGTGTELTDNTQKVGRLASPHYANAELPIALVWGNSGPTFNHVNVGGGTSFMNTATALNFYTATNNTTTVGNLALSIDSTGNANFQGNNISGASELVRGINTGSLNLSGGGTVDQGGNIILNGNNIPGEESDIVFRAATFERLRWDNSAAEWNFQGNEIKGTQLLTAGNATGQLNIAGGSTDTLGARIILRSENHLTEPNNMIFRAGATNTLVYLNDTSTFDFQGNDIVGVGDLTVGGDMITTSGDIYNAVSTYRTNISGGTDSFLGGNIALIGQSHATQPGDILFRSDTTEVLQWNNSDIHWDYKDNPITRVSSISRGLTANALFLSGSTAPGIGAEIQLFGQDHLTNGNDLLLRSGGNTKLKWDDNAANWDFQGSDIVDVGDLVLSGSNIVKASTSGGVNLVGGTSLSTGSNISLFGNTNATNANDIVLRAENSVKLQWNDNAGQWDFHNRNIVGVGKLEVDGGAKISVQNKVDGGSANGIFLWDTDDTNFGMYMAQSGVGKSLSDGISCTSLDGRVSHHIRTRVNATSTQGFIWENNTENCLMSLTADTGDLYTKGGVNVGGIVNGNVFKFRYLNRPTNTGDLSISAGDEYNRGANFLMYGGDHATSPNDFFFRTNGTTRLQWDDSASHWDFHNRDIDGVGDAKINGTFSLGSPTELTISSGAITVTKSFHTVDTEGDAATDDLDTINGGTDGDEIILSIATGSRIPTFKHATGNIRLKGGTDFVPTSVDDTLRLIFLGDRWREVSRSNNG